ncbi:hypothetical protein D3C72_2016600 [compost metagenome]
MVFSALEGLTCPTLPEYFIGIVRSIYGLNKRITFCIWYKLLHSGFLGILCRIIYIG